MIRTVRILRRAVQDLEEARRYVERDRPAVARALLIRLVAAAESLAEHPERGALPRDERLRSLGYRFLVAEPYLLFYKVGRSVVRVYRVLHGQRRYQSIL